MKRELAPLAALTALATVAFGVAAATSSAAIVIGGGGDGDPFGNNDGPDEPPVDQPDTPQPPVEPSWEYHELLINGTFDTGDTQYWNSPATAGPQWQVRTNPVGQGGLGRTNDAFATALTSGSWDKGTTSVLQQTAALPADIAPQVKVSLDAFSFFDRLDVEIEWLVDLGGILQTLSVDDIAMSGAVPTTSSDNISTVLTIPDTATHFTFRATGHLVDGSWLDAGFDNASVLAARSVPEPAVAGVLAMASLIALRRRSA